MTYCLKRAVERLAAFAVMATSALAAAGCGVRSFTTVELNKAVPEAPVSGSLPLMPEGVPYGLPRAYLTLNASWDGKDENLVKISFGDTIFVPDPGARFLLRYNPSILYDDDIKLATSGGLLTKINATATDRSGDAIKKVVEISAEALKLTGAAGPLQLRNAARQVGPLNKKFSVSIQFDPFDDSSVRRLEAELAAVGISVFVLKPDGNDLEAAPSKKTECNNSLCYRVERQILIGVQIAGDDTQSQSKFYLARVPDPTATYALDVTRTACVKRVSEITFTSGMLSTLAINKPSEVSGCLQIPLDALKAIVAVPGELLKFQSDSLASETVVLDARAALLTAEIALEEARAARLAANDDP